MFKNARLVNLPSAIALWLFSLVGLGCAGPAPHSLGLPIEERRTADISQRSYDTNGDGKIDYWQDMDAGGRVTVLQFDANNDGTPELRVDRAAPNTGDRHLIVLLDSVPFGIMQEAWQQGHFRLFYPPRRTIAPFPVMTDLSFSELFGCSPSPGVESSYYDGHHLHGGYSVYAAGGNVKWYQYVDYHLSPSTHTFAYLQPFTWFLSELGAIQRKFIASDQPLFIGYCVGSSAVGAHFGRNGHQKALARVDQFCEFIMHETKGRTQITLLSDHGHNLVESKRIPLSELLEDAGYHLVENSALSKPNDVAVPEFSVINCASIYTQSPAAVARDVAGFQGIELTAYLDTDGKTIIVLDRTGRASIRRLPEGLYSYECSFGDPLKLKPVWDELARNGKVDAQGYAHDADIFAATNAGYYPDPLFRLWRAFNGLVEYPPQVYVSVADGYHCGSDLMTKLVHISSAHGSLNFPSSCGFVMTTAGELPPVMRMENLGEQLRKIGVPIRHAENGSPVSSAHAAH